MSTRQPIALSLSGFQFSYRNNYFDWRLLHGIDIDNVIRLTDVQAVEDCLDTLQRGAFAAERDRLSPANCVQLFRLLQLAIEYCAHLRAAHALLLDCYNVATATAESWKAAARTYLDVGSSFLSDSLGMGDVSREALDATDAAKSALEAADRDYNAALDALEAEDTRARHFRFRKQRTEISWSQLNAADADRLVASLDVGLLEAVLPNLTYGSITSEDDEQLTPHHFGQLIPLAQMPGRSRLRAVAGQRDRGTHGASHVGAAGGLCGHTHSHQCHAGAPWQHHLTAFGRASATRGAPSDGRCG
ncbi:hypothetical protein VaNZ11_016541, partial [Volvox africanus]